jgi:HEAT repeat protein
MTGIAQIRGLAAIGFVFAALAAFPSSGFGGPDDAAKPDRAPDLKTLITKLQDPDAAVRLQAAKALEKMGRNAEDAIPALTNALHDADEDVRIVAGRALRKIKPVEEPREKKEPAPAAKGVEELIKKLKDPDEVVRIKAARALGKMGPEAKTAVPALTEAGKDADEDVRAAAERALKAIGPSDEDPAVREWTLKLKDLDETVRLKAAKMLEKMGPAAKAAVPALKEALQDADEDVRTVAARALDKIEGKKPDESGAN